jgi:hypothetical protein
MIADFKDPIITGISIFTKLREGHSTRLKILESSIARTGQFTLLIITNTNPP